MEKKVKVIGDKKERAMEAAAGALCFILPVLLWVLVCVFHGIYPFGSKSVMTGDITYQFIDYLAYFKSIFTSSNDLTYTFSKTMGGDMAGFSAYYLFSPFNFILLLFPNRLLPLGLLMLIVVKCAFMSLSFFFMLKRMYGFRMRSVIFAVTYSLMGYVVVYFQLYAYFDDMMLLPLIVLGIHRLFEDHRKRLLYTFSLALAIILNYYVGWMLCLFCLLYFIYRSLCEEGGSIERTVSFVSCSVFAGMMSAFVLLPSVLSLRGEKDSFHLSMYLTMNPADFFSRFYTDSFRGNISTCLPNIYCGVLVCVLLVMYFFNRNIRLRERLVSLGFLIFLILNMCVNTLNVAWHGFNRPIGFPYRYSFLFTFMILLLAFRGSIDFDWNGLRRGLAVTWILYIIYSAYILFFGSSVTGRREIVMDMALLLAVSAILVFRHRRAFGAGAFIFLLALVQLTDLGENLRHAFYYFEFADMDEYQKFVDRVGASIADIRREDDGFYRMEKTFRRTHNDSMQFNYAGLTHYSSCEKKDVISYMKKLGFRDNGNWSFYDGGSTALVDSVFGIKYIISHYDYMGKKYKRFGKTKYPEGDREDKYFIYRNQFVLPLMFASDRAVLDMDVTRSNPFEFQNALADSISGSRNNMFTQAEISEYNLVNLAEHERDGVRIFKKRDPGAEAYIEYVVKITDETDGLLLEGYFDAPDYQQARIMLGDDDKGEYFSEYHWSVLDFAKHDAGEELSIKIIPEADELRLTDTWIYFENMFQLKKWVNAISEDQCTLEKLTSSHLKGQAVLTGEKQLVFSFPYEDDWEVRVDGQRVTTRKAAGLLLSVNAGAGTHDVELIYHQAGRMSGIFISLVALLGFIAYYAAGRLTGREA